MSLTPLPLTNMITDYLRLTFQLLLVRYLGEHIWGAAAPEDVLLDSMDTPHKLLNTEERDVLKSMLQHSITDPAWVKFVTRQSETPSETWSIRVGERKVPVAALATLMLRKLSSDVHTILNAAHRAEEMEQAILRWCLNSTSMDETLHRAVAACLFTGIDPERMAEAVILNDAQLDMEEMATTAKALYRKENKSHQEVILFALLGNERFQLSTLIGTKMTRLYRLRADRVTAALTIVDRQQTELQEKYDKLENRVDNMATHLSAHLNGGEP